MTTRSPEDISTLQQPPATIPQAPEPSQTKAGNMPKVRLKQPIVELHGTLYEVVFKRAPHVDDIIVTKKPDMSNVVWTPAQKAHRQRFKKAAAYAKAALAEPRVRAQYERKAKKQNKSAWGLAVSDYFDGKDLLTKPEK